MRSHPDFPVRLELVVSSSATANDRPAGLIARAIATLPQGHTLPKPVWRTRHRFMLGVIWLQLAGLAVGALVVGRGVGDTIVSLGPILACALAGALPTGGRRVRGSMVAFGALYCSAALVDLSGGATEAHFHFFVMVAMLAAYEEWVPYLLAVGFVIVHHGLVGVLAPELVYSSPEAIASPLLWALIHAAFVVALSVVSIISWRLNENARAESEHAHERTRASEGEFRSAFDDAPIGMAIVGLDGHFERVNRSLSELTDFTADQLLGMTLAEIVGIAPAEPGAGDSTSVERPFRRADRSRGWGLLQQSIVRDEHGTAVHLLVQLLDLTQRKHAERQLAHAADHDGLTRLPNRACFERLASKAIAALPEGRSLALLFVDIDNFKSINDSLGHGAGDSLLILVAERLRAALAPNDLLARFGGDEFVILLPDSSEEEARARAARVQAAVQEPCDLGGRRRFVTASVGVTMSDRRDASIVELTRDSDAAMYRAKGAGKDGVVFFDERQRDESQRRQDYEDGLRTALERGEFELHYQIEVDLETHATFGVEALIRWRRADGSVIAPDDFIPLAERSGLIVPIGRWVIGEACRQAAAWRAEGVTGDDMLMCVNLSAAQLAHGELVADVAAALERHALPGRLLCLELTESAITDDPARADRTMLELKALGVKLAIDGFGTGQSSLAHLRHLMPVDILKIDRSFISGLLDGQEEAAVITTVVQLAQRLGLTAIAEGIEEASQAERLRQLRCSVGQGFVLGRPQPAAQIAEALVLQRALRAAAA